MTPGKPVKIFAALIGATVLGTSTQAADTEFASYYIVEDAVSKNCKVVDLKPTPDGVPALVYESRAKAERALVEASAWNVPDCSGPPPEKSVVADLKS